MKFSYLKEPCYITFITMETFNNGELVVTNLLSCISDLSEP